MLYTLLFDTVCCCKNQNRLGNTLYFNSSFIFGFRMKKERNEKQKNYRNDRICLRITFRNSSIAKNEKKTSTKRNEIDLKMNIHLWYRLVNKNQNTIKELLFIDRLSLYLFFFCLFRWPLNLFIFPLFPLWAAFFVGVCLYIVQPFSFTQIHLN